MRRGTHSSSALPRPSSTAPNSTCFSERRHRLVAPRCNIAERGTFTYVATDRSAVICQDLHRGGNCDGRPCSIAYSVQSASAITAALSSRRVPSSRISPCRTTRRLRCAFQATGRSSWRCCGPICHAGRAGCDCNSDKTPPCKLCAPCCGAVRHVANASVYSFRVLFLLVVCLFARLLVAAVQVHAAEERITGNRDPDGNVLS